jgi:ActR/RegA family two-component response regulator
MTPSTLRALVVEDDRSWQQILSEILSDCGLEVQTVADLEAAVTALKTQPHRLAVVDLSLSPNDHNNYDGLRVLEAVPRLDPNCRAILLTGFATVELAVAALTDYGAFTFLRKENFQRGQFREIVYRALASAPQTTPSSLVPVMPPVAAPRVDTVPASAAAVLGKRSSSKMTPVGAASWKSCWWMPVSRCAPAAVLAKRWVPCAGKSSPWPWSTSR